MISLKKIYNGAYGLGLYLFYKRQFDINLFNNKRIAVIGPANSAYDTGKGSFIDSFDYVIRINKAPLLLKEGKHKADIGEKADILFHSFFENDFSGGGSIDFDLFEKLGIKWVVNPISEYPGYRVTFNFYKKYALPQSVFHLKRNIYKKIKRPLGKFRPTIGFCALVAALESEFSELYIAGFTFFKTAYGDGYRDHFKTSDQAQKYIKSMDLHNPDAEFDSFLRLLKQYPRKNIQLDETLSAIVRSHQSN